MLISSEAEQTVRIGAATRTPQCSTEAKSFIRQIRFHITLLRSSTIVNVYRVAFLFYLFVALLLAWSRLIEPSILVVTSSLLLMCKERICKGANANLARHSCKAKAIVDKSPVVASAALVSGYQSCFSHSASGCGKFLANVHAGLQSLRSLLEYFSECFDICRGFQCFTSQESGNSPARRFSLSTRSLCLYIFQSYDASVSYVEQDVVTTSLSPEYGTVLFFCYWGITSIRQYIDMYSFSEWCLDPLNPYPPHSHPLGMPWMPSQDEVGHKPCSNDAEHQLPLDEGEIMQDYFLRDSNSAKTPIFSDMPNQPRIFVLLRRCLFDNDDEVRDRATLYLNTLGDGSVTETDKAVKEFLFGSLDIPLTNLETSLKNYLRDPAEEPFDLYSVPKEVKSQSLAEKKAPSKKPTGLSAQPAAPTSAPDAYERLLSSIPEFASFGKLFKSSAPVELTEAETEYAVNVVKHIFDRHVVFQYNCTNTIPEQCLENVTVIVDASEAEEFAEVGTKPLKSLPYDTPAQTFVAFEKPESVPAVGKFSNVLRFTVKEVDPSTGEAEDDGVEDEYQLEDFEIVAADYILKLGVSNFKNAWENMDPASERVDEYGLGPRESLAEAVNAVIILLGMHPCEGTEVVPSNSRSHTCLLSGVYIGNVKVLVRLSFGIDGTKEVAMKLAVRSEDESVSEAIHEIVASG
ncbi:Coatomer subunit gamma [Sesamum angolense]|uniref:Coatomer subunit gamma n=1 Tax=Sesamum angolense TaxID=2727404 RepID=A0AAE2C166_9LAMI|nr:Coatomer subunit gamma [Sesamum angolense]